VDYLSSHVSEVHPQYVMVLELTAYAHELSGRMDAAILAQEKCLNILEREKGVGHLSYERALSAWTRYVERQRRPLAGDALTRWEALRAHFEQAPGIGRYHNRYGVCLNKLATIHTSIGEHSNALPLC